MPEHAFILGGTGQIGRALVDALLARGWHVTASHRGHGDVPRALMNGGTRLVAFDREAPKALENALGGGVDALIDTIAFDEGHADQLLAVQGLVGSITLISSISVYCDAAGRTLDEATDETNCPVMPIPIAENHMTVPGGSATYSTRKVSLERKLLEHAKRPVTIVRPGAIHGPGSRHPREWWFVKRFLDGRGMVPLKYQGGSRFSTTSAIWRP
jgi:nucleoside-diphosphate-sugar epimerase